MIKKIFQVLIGENKDPLNKEVFHQLSLVAFLAWVGLGADGLSSSSYGPEEAYRALGGHHEHLALYLAIATAFTVFIISASYSLIIAAFPAGGGGYVVTSKLLGEGSGLVSGAALVVDYVLTISISIAACADAMYSFLPPGWLHTKLTAEVVLIVLLIWLNMRGMKESIQVLLPIFLVFIVTHAIVVIWGVAAHSSSLPAVVQGAFQETGEMVQGEQGWWGFLVLLFTAYSLGGGTYTGIEAVSNGMSTLREPKVKTGIRTMLYMAISLALTAGGILLCYMLWDVQHVPGKTMNAVLSEKIFAGWNLGGLDLGPFLHTVTLASEAFLCIIAGQAGFVAGPIVLSNMAVDSWLPHRFGNLSHRLVRLNGILVMGLAALFILWLTGGKVAVLVVLYSINVFLTFTLSQLSMCIHWLKSRQEDRNWFPKLAINGMGLALTSIILVATTLIKFRQGGWVTIVITGSFIALCLVVKRHYKNVLKALKRLDEMLIDLPFPENAPEMVSPDPSGPTAVLLVNGYNGLGIHAMFSVRKLFSHQEFKNFIFITVARVDSSKFKGVQEIDNLKHATEKDLARYVELARRMGYSAESRYALDTDVLEAVSRLCEGVAADYVSPIFFAGKLIFARENFLNRALHNQTAMEIQRRLLFEGHNMIVMPIRVL